MGTHTKVFNTHSEYQAFISSGITYLPNVSVCEDNYDLHVNDNGTIVNPSGETPTPPTPSGYSSQYLTFVMLENGSISTNFEDVYCSIDGENWVTSIDDLQEGDNVLVKGNLRIPSDSCYAIFDVSGRHNIEGNIMSVYDETGFRTRTTFDNSGDTLTYFFSSDYDLISAENLVLPVTSLTSYCYNGMFYGCTSLTTPPSILPATTLANYCYYYMFYGCTSLTTAPELPATTLANYCYYYMFYGCTSLTTAPELPATTLANSCYSYMFEGCTSLTTAPSILPATTLAEDCYSHMFEGCTSLVTAPELPATTLASYCYAYMFYGCEYLMTITCLATDISEFGCTSNWVANVGGGSGFSPEVHIFTKAASMTDWELESPDGIPYGWSVQDAS